MKISEVKTAFKIADVRIKHGDVLEFDYLEELYDENNQPLPQSILKENIGRVYVIVVDGIVKKIGGSEDKGGMKGTLAIYKTGALNGQPSLRSIGIWWLMYHELLENKIVELYMIYQNSFVAKVKGLFGEKDEAVSISYKHLENACLMDYFSVESTYPEWNYQENNRSWPAEVDAIEAICKENKGKTGADKISDIGTELRKRGFTNTKVVRKYSTKEGNELF